MWLSGVPLRRGRRRSSLRRCCRSETQIAATSWPHYCSKLRAGGATVSWARWRCVKIWCQGGWVVAFAPRCWFPVGRAAARGTDGPRDGPCAGARARGQRLWQKCRPNGQHAAAALADMHGSYLCRPLPDTCWPQLAFAGRCEPARQHTTLNVETMEVHVTMEVKPNSPFTSVDRG